MPSLRCPCDVTLRGETDDELVANATAHIEADHPDLVGQLGRDQLLAMSEEA